MNTQQLEDRITYKWSGHGHYKVSVVYRNNEIRFTTTNMGAIDAAQMDTHEIERGRFYPTKKAGLKALWNEAMRIHAQRNNGRVIRA